MISCWLAAFYALVLLSVLAHPKITNQFKESWWWLLSDLALDFTIN
jgi:hypothetical protein